MKVLNLSFLDESGRETTFRPKHVGEELSAATVRMFMEGLVALDLFVKDDVKLYVEPLSARYIETKITQLF